MLRSGRFPLALHSVIEYAAGVLFIVAPFLLGFEDDTATAVSIVIGVLVLAIAASTDWPMALMRAIPIPFHLALDLGLAALLVASPFVFDFSDETEPTAFFIALGVIHLLLTLGTRFVADDEAHDHGAAVTPGGPAVTPDPSEPPPPEPLAPRG